MMEGRATNHPEIYEPKPVAAALHGRMQEASKFGFALPVPVSAAFGAIPDISALMHHVKNWG